MKVRSSETRKGYWLSVDVSVIASPFFATLKIKLTVDEIEEKKT